MANLKITWFISAHGFGHAARAVAIMEALYERNQNIEFLVVTEIPKWFFELNELPISFFNSKTDVGLIQKDAFFEDIPQTIEQLNSFYFNVQSRFQNWDSIILPFKPDLIVADICPAALDYAHSRNIPSVLIENFTWDWLYDFYSDFKKDFLPISEYMQSCWTKASKRFQIQPFCGEKLTNSIAVPPVSRKPKKNINQTLSDLQLDSSKKTVLLTMGGVPMQFDFYDELLKHRSIQFIIPGAHKENLFKENLRILTHHSAFYHPDLVSISDAIIAKVGYSTIAETHNANKRLGFVPRFHFRETQPLVDFIDKNMTGIQITNDELSSGTWLSQLDDLLEKPLKPLTSNNGADVIADELQKLLSKS